MMARIEMREDHLLTIQFNPQKGDQRQVIIDEKQGDIRITDGKCIIKIRTSPLPREVKKKPSLAVDLDSGKLHRKLEDILVDDIFVWSVKKTVGECAIHG